MKKNNGEKITIDKLAEMMNKSFSNTPTKADIVAIRDDITVVNKKMDKVIEEHGQEIVNIEGRVKVLEKALEID